MARYKFTQRPTRRLLFFSATAILLLSTGFPAAASTISVEPNFVDFGRVAIGDSSSETIAVVNTGDGLLSITQIEFTFNQFDSFTWNGNIVDPLVPGERRPIRVTFTAQDFSFSFADMWIHSDATNASQYYVQLIGEGNYDVDPCVPLLRCTGGVLAFPDLNSNGSSEIGVALPGSSTVVIRDGSEIWDDSTDKPISEISFGEFEAHDLLVLPDLDTSSAPEIASLNELTSGHVRVQIRDSLSGDLVSNLWYGLQYASLAMAMVPDYSGNGLPEIAVLGSEASTDAVRVQIRDTAGGFLDNVFLGAQSIAKDLVSVTDTSGNGVPELGILGVVKDSDQVRMQMWDAKTSDHLTNVWFAKVYKPKATITIPDINTNGSDEIVAMGVDPATQNIRVQARDSKSQATHYNIWLGKVNRAVDLVRVNDINGNGFDDLAILLETPVGTGRVRIHDGLNGEFIRNLFYTVVENPAGLAVMPDYSGNGFDELAVLGENTGVRHVQILDTSTGTQVNRIDFP